MALDLGLHKQVKDLPLVEHERRVRVFWNIFVYEKCVIGMVNWVHIKYDTHAGCLLPRWDGRH